VCMLLRSYHRTTWAQSSLVMRCGYSTSTLSADISGSTVMHSRSQSQNNVMLSVWWDVHGVEMFKLLPDNTIVTGDYYCKQLQCLSDELESKRPQRGKVRFLHDNCRPHVAKVTRQKLAELG
jgi:hypothetical protein